MMIRAGRPSTSVTACRRERGRPRLNQITSTTRRANHFSHICIRDKVFSPLDALARFDLGESRSLIVRKPSQEEAKGPTLIATLSLLKSPRSSSTLDSTVTLPGFDGQDRG
jgi:hypothetical protein